MYVGKKVTRVDAYDKVIGRTKYTDDLCDKSAYIARILHSTIANGRVLSIDTSEAEKIPGVVKVFTCFDLKEKHYFPTAGHPWSTDESHLKTFVKGVRGYFSYYLRRFSLCFCLNNAFQPVLRSQTATMVKKHFDFIICFALLNHKNSIRFVFLRMVILGG